MFFCSIITTAQTTQKTTRILFLMDGSSSMLDNWQSDKNRFAAAAKLVSQITDTVQQLNSKVEFAVRVFGHEHYVQDKNCFDTKLEVGFLRQNANQVANRLDHIHPKGVSPIAHSLQEAATQDFQMDDRYAYSIILVTDGGESCGGDICATMEQLVNKRINFRPYIISMIDYEPLKKTYECMGKYMVVKEEKDFQPVIKSILDDNQNFYADNTTKYTPTVTKQPNAKAPEIVKREDTPKENTLKKSNINTIKNNGHYSKIASITKIVMPQPVVVIPLIDFSFPLEPQTEISPIAKSKINITRINSVFAPQRMSNDINFVINRPIAIKPLPNFSIPKYLKEELQTPTPPVPTKTDESNITTATNTPKENSNDPGTMKLFFTNGQGKYYASEPRIEIKDIKTGKIVYNKYRTVDFNKQPSPIELPNGKYAVSVKNTDKKAHFEINIGQESRVEIVVGKASLSFKYNTNNEPPEGFIARVSKRFEPGPLVEHPTDEKLQYEASNYHIEINTLPASMYNIDLVFNEERIITLLKPGTLQVMNTDEIGRVKLLCERGRQFIPFYEMNIYGEQDLQKLDLTPGNYKAEYQVRNQSGKMADKIKNFNVSSDQTTQVTFD